MKYRRGKIIAVTLLSVVMALSLLGFSVVWSGWQRVTPSGATEKIFSDANPPTFDDLYVYENFPEGNTGRIELGFDNTVPSYFSLKRDTFSSGSFDRLLNDKKQRGFSSLQSLNERPYPLFSNTDMQQIVAGENVTAPVIMLDPAKKDDVIILELLNLANPLSSWSMKRNNIDIPRKLFDPGVEADNVYTGRGVKINYLYDEQLEEVYDEATHSYIQQVVYYDQLGNKVEGVTTNPNTGTEIMAPDSQGNYSGADYYTIGAIAYSSRTVRGVFSDEGYYEFSFKTAIANKDNMLRDAEFTFGFYIVHKSNYLSFPSFIKVASRVTGLSEIYNYSYGSGYPKVEYKPTCFEIAVDSIDNKPFIHNTQQYFYQFYNIGSYTMTSRLIYVYPGSQKPLYVSRYKPYTSKLNILGFQAYYGSSKGNPNIENDVNAIPFFDSTGVQPGSDITAWVKNYQGLLTSGRNNLDVSDAKAYSQRLADLLDTQTSIATANRITPVRTNFPPVKLVGNVNYATGKDADNGEVVLSTVAFHGVNDYQGNTKIWHHDILEVGEPFTTAGEYIINIYFRLNSDALCQQTFYFVISNYIDIKFQTTTTVNGVSQNNTLSFSELVRNNSTVLGQEVTIAFDRSSLGNYEIMPTLALEWAQLGDPNYEPDTSFTPDQQTSNYNFKLQEGHYRLTVAYGAYQEGQSVTEIIVDKQPATGFVARSNAASLTGLPNNAAVFGLAPVSLSWANKASGIGYRQVNVAFYQTYLESGNNYDPNYDRNYDKFGITETRNQLFAASSLDVTTSTSANIYTLNDENAHLTRTEDGWLLDDNFTRFGTEIGAGLYKITVIDEVGNETVFILLIDNSTPTFTQSVISASSTANITDFPDARYYTTQDNPAVKVGFGRNKLLRVSSFNNLPNGILNSIYDASEKWPALRVPLVSVSISEDSGIYNPVSEEDLLRGYTILNGEHTYYFRVIDALGNIGEYYIILTHDRSRATVYAEDNYTDFAVASRGIIEIIGTGESSALDPTASLVTAQGGMTNRHYLSFGFNQLGNGVGDNYGCRVASVRVKFYRLNFNKNYLGDPNPNYPFAANESAPFKVHYSNRIIYETNASVNQNDRAGEYRIALYHEANTPSGLYIITRSYVSGGTDADPNDRDYWFLVDDTGMLTFIPDKYQTDLEVIFGGDSREAAGAKEATATEFNAQKNWLSSNMPAYVKGFTSKYDSRLTFCGKTFSSLIPRFSYINNGLTTLMGEGTQLDISCLGDLATASGDSTFKLVIADNSRSFSVAMAGGSIQEVIPANRITSANYGILTLLLETGYGTTADIARNGKNMAYSGWQYDAENNHYTYLYVIDPNDSSLSKLEFKYQNDAASYYASVDVRATENSWRASAGLPTPTLSEIVHSELLDDNDVTASKTFYTDELSEYILLNKPQDGDSISVDLITDNGTVTTYTIIFDTFNPNYNLLRVKAQDNLAKDLDLTALSRYIYGVSNDFAFVYDDSCSHYLGTKEITYREIYANGTGGEAAAVSFKLGTLPVDAETEAADKPVIKPRTFASLVGLQYNEVKYFRITETDYAGHSISYTIQLQGDKYNGDLSFVGAVPSDDNLTLGVEMRVRDTSIDQFLANNSSFKFVSGEDYFYVLDGMATWSVAGVLYTGENTPNFSLSAELTKVINYWVDQSAADGTKCAYTLYDRIGAVEQREFYNIREDTPVVQLDAFTEGGSSVYLQTTNYDELSAVFYIPEIAERFQIEIVDADSPDKKIPNVRYAMPVTALHNYNLKPDQNLIIKVTDPFGRVVITEYHGQGKNGLRFIPYGNTVTKNIDGNDVIFVGDKRGVELQFLRSLYAINVFDVKSGAKLNDMLSVMMGDTTIYYFRPTVQEDTRMYRLEAVGKMSQAVLFETIFAFDTRMPSVRWTNASDQEVELNSIFTGTVNMQLIDNYTIQFGVTTSFTRSYNGNIERVTLRPGTETYQFDRVGKYVVTLRNEIWATNTYEFEIAGISNTLVNVYDDGVEIQPSATLLAYENPETGKIDYINNYMFTTDGSYKNYTEQGLSVVPSPSTNRVLYSETQEAYFDILESRNTLIWCLAIPAATANGGTAYTSRVYFATTGVSTVNISSDDVGMLINGDQTLTKASTPYQVYTSLGNQDLTFSMTYGRNVDSNNVPYNQFTGNTLLIDCYRNGELVKSMNYNDTFAIGEYDSGYYEFYVHDLVGNHLMFGGGNNQVDHYSIVNLSRPMVLINNSNPVNNMVYNDSVEFKVIDIADDLLSRYYGSETFARYFYISDMKIFRDNEELTEYTLSNVKTKTPQNPYFFNKKGNYRIEMRYIIGDHTYVEGNYAFQIIPSSVPMQELNLNVYADIGIVSVKKNNYPVMGYDNLSMGEPLSFSAGRNAGRYEVTLQTNDYVNGVRTHTISFNIGYKSNLSSYFLLNTTSGSQTTSPVTLYYKPMLLYMFRGDITLELYKDRALVATRQINSQTVYNSDVNLEASLSTNEFGLGMYSIIAYDTEGDIVYADSFSVVQAASSMGRIIIGAIVALLAVGVLFFIRIRHKMSVK